MGKEMDMTPGKVYEKTKERLTKLNHEALRPAREVYDEGLRQSNLIRNKNKLVDPVRANRDFTNRNSLLKKEYSRAVSRIEATYGEGLDVAWEVYKEAEG